ncbi:MAG: transglycosylase domain-containing protein, partial [Lachnospiraceae bacterium]|nr:transglycosylase domain-containing protein [Lachnospiraceae bacterium]
MNFGRRSVEKLQKSLTSRSVKRMRRLGLSMIHLGIVAVIGAGILLMCLGIGAFRGVLDTAPDIGHIDVTPSGFSTFVYDKDGRQIAKLVSTNANRIPVTMDMVPDQLGKAFVAIEDQRFFEHKGIDIYGIIRAGVIAVQTRTLSQGASTITQQLLKNNVFTTWTSESGNMDRIRRKIQEQYLAIELEKQMDKDVILLNYMNTINLGHNTLGVQAASLRYFGKSVSDLTLSECAVIAAITQNPTAFDPIAYPENNERRRKDVLDRMLAQEFISQEDYDEAMEDDVYSRIKIVDDATPDEEVNTYFVDALTDQVLEDLLAAGYTEGQAYTLLYSGGLSIFSTQDSAIQKIADDVCSDPNTYPAGAQLLLDYALTIQAEDGTLTNYSDEMMTLHFRETNSAYTPYFDTEEAADAAIEQYKQDIMGPGDTVLAENRTLTIQPQISLTIEDQHTGHVVAMVGGRGKKIASRTLNRATSSKRQPGSTFKIVAVYAPALDASDLSLAYTQLDAPYQYEDGTPVRNWYGESYRGLQSLRMGIQESLNIVAVKTLTYITPQLGYEYAVDLGISTLANGDVVGDQVFYDARQPLGLGGITYGVKNIELNGAYATVANDGVYIKPKLYTRITDHEGNVILDTNDYPERRVLKSSTAWLLTNAMQDVVTKGTGASVNWGTTAIAGKTGTTSDYNDVWFSGYTNYYTATT